MTEEVKGKGEPEKKEPVENKPAETPTVEQLMEENKRLKEQNFKVIGEKKDYKSKFEDMVKSKEDAETKKLQEKEDYKTLLEKANAEIESLKGTVSKKQEDGLMKSIALDIQKLAGDAIDPSDILQQLNISEENVDLENEKLSDIASQIDEVRKNKPYLFKKENSTMTTKLPNQTGVFNTDSNKSLKSRIASKLLNG